MRKEDLSVEEIRDMSRLIPNNMPHDLDDLIEIFKQEK